MSGVKATNQALSTRVSSMRCLHYPTMFVTVAVFHWEMLALNSDRDRNARAMLVVSDTFHSGIVPYLAYTRVSLRHIPSIVL